MVPSYCGGTAVSRARPPTKVTSVGSSQAVDLQTLPSQIDKLPGKEVIPHRGYGLGYHCTPLAACLLFLLVRLKSRKRHSDSNRGGQ